MDEMTRQRLVQALLGKPGMDGTQGGQVQESPLMGSERFSQFGAGGAMALLGGGIGDAIAGPFGWPLALPGLDNMANATEPNIRDVYADQKRMRRQQGR